MSKCACVRVLVEEVIESFITAAAAAAAAAGVCAAGEPIFGLVLVTPLMRA